jgi:hypothetical protein
MSDEPDAELSRLFVAANQPLPHVDFQARVMSQLRRPRGWAGVAKAFAATAGAIVSGPFIGVAAAFRSRLGYLGAMLASGLAVLIWVALTP